MLNEEACKTNTNQTLSTFRNLGPLEDLVLWFVLKIAHIKTGREAATGEG